MRLETTDGREIEISTRKAAGNLVGISESRLSSWWWPIIRESSAGAWQRNEDITIDNVLTNPTLYTCVTLIVSDVAKMRAGIVEIDSDGIETETSSAAFSPVLRKPNHYQTAFQFFRWWMMSKLLHGNTYVLKRRDKRGVVDGLYVIDPARVKILVAPDSSLFYELSPSRDGSGMEPATLGRVVVVPAREIIHDRCEETFHPLLGVSPIFAAGAPALLAKYITNNAERLFSNGSAPGGIITATGQISLETAQRLKAQFETEYTGDNYGKVAVLGDGLQYVPMGLATAVDSQLIEVLKWTDEQVAKCFHMPMFKVGGPLPPYSSAEVVTQQYFSDCLQSHVTSLEQVLTEGLELPSYYAVRFNTDDLIRMDSATTMDIAVKGVNGGILTPNEGRRPFDKKPKKGGDTIYMQHQDYSIAVLADRDAKGAVGAGLAAAPQPEPVAEPKPEDDAEKSADVFHAMLAAQLTKGVAAYASKLWTADDAHA
jgi:HK97 family phage portal protein